MKCWVLFLLAAWGADAETQGGTITIHGSGDDAVKDVMQQFNGVVAAAQQKLSIAQRHHKKVVKKARKQTSKFLTEEAQKLGDVVAHYQADLAAAQQKLLQKEAEARAVLASAEKATSNSGDWRDPTVTDRARLGAQLASADRAARRDVHRRARSVREAEERAEEPLDEQGQKLGMRIGDLTSFIEKAKKALEDRVGSQAAPESPPAASAKKDAKASLAQLRGEVATAMQQDQVAAAAAAKRLDSALTAAEKEVANKAAAVEQNLDAAEKEEISKVLGRPGWQPPSALAAAAAKRKAPSTATANHRRPMFKKH